MGDSAVSRFVVRSSDRRCEVAGESRGIANGLDVEVRDEDEREG